MVMWLSSDHGQLSESFICDYWKVSLKENGALPFALFFLSIVWKGDTLARAEAIILGSKYERHTLGMMELQA